ncbi:MAG: hypothetical protein D6753_12335 [Planctomycetota bacterium]|nr:MAG: hypothetical protein D6753_12335 [Planctomycetota bacterium]
MPDSDAVPTPHQSENRTIPASLHMDPTASRHRASGTGWSKHTAGSLELEAYQEWQQETSDRVFEFTIFRSEAEFRLKAVLEKRGRCAERQILGYEPIWRRIRHIRSTHYDSPGKRPLPRHFIVPEFGRLCWAK